ncbi:MAG: acyloxyacyl hydrolase [Flavobacterium sp.]|nr:MAG: acyloxyacyl hydrolase [Flavobacterium sp.]
MKRLLLFLLVPIGVFSQTNGHTNIQADFFRGNVYRHTDDIDHLITGHPSGVLLSFNHQTFGTKEWEQAYNYPDYGFSFQYQDFKNDILGECYAIGAHYNFYFFKRHLMFRLSQGIGMTTNPYDKETNFKNNAFGSRFMSSNLFMLDYKKDNLIGRFGIQAGFMFTHFSNGRFKSPNSGINTYALNIGVNYNLNEKPAYIKNDSLLAQKFSEPIKFNFVFRTGLSESQVVGSGQKPFYHLGLYADKRIGRKSALQLGTDVFFTGYLKEYIKFYSEMYPERDYVDPDTDYKRIGVFVGHELFINNLSIETQLGYYVYKPFKYEIDIYQRLGAKYYLTKNVFAAASLKAHGARAEAVELGFGVRI